jgi:hypothetical protein
MRIDMAKRDAPQPVTLTGQVYKVQTLVDGGIRLTLDLPESAADDMGRLARMQLFGVAIEIELSPLINNRETTNAIQERTVRKSQRTPAE